MKIVNLYRTAENFESFYRQAKLLDKEEVIKDIKTFKKDVKNTFFDKYTAYDIDNIHKHIDNDEILLGDIYTILENLQQLYVI